ncbi:MAG: hypothetical protein ABI869_06010, partial [Actinomycetota bacterium]
VSGRWPATSAFTMIGCHDVPAVVGATWLNPTGTVVSASAARMTPEVSRAPGNTACVVVMATAPCRPSGSSFGLGATAGGGLRAVGAAGHRIVVPSATRPLLRFRSMSDHTERLAKISERVSAAKEFL